MLQGFQARWHLLFPPGWPDTMFRGTHRNTYIPVCYMSLCDVKTETPFSESLEEMQVETKQKCFIAQGGANHPTFVFSLTYLLSVKCLYHWWWNSFQRFGNILISDMSLPIPDRIARVWSGCTTTGSSGGRGEPGQEMHHGIALYHVAENDEKVVWERGESRWSAYFVLRHTVVWLC